MLLEEAKEIDGWSSIDEEQRNSTISYFKGGVSNEKGVEILVWKGEQYQGLETTIEQPPEWANYIIEELVEDDLASESFAETEVGAWNKVNMLTESYGTDD